MKHHEHDPELRAGEHALTDTGQIIFVIIFFAVWITDSFIFRYSMIVAAFVPLYIRLPVGAVLLVISALFALQAHKSIFGTPEREPGILREGIYRIVRHPMYFGSWLFFVGFAVITFSLASIGLVVLALLFYLYVARHEEKYLETGYALEYADYKAKVPMMFPLPKRRKQSRR